MPRPWCRLSPARRCPWFPLNDQVLFAEMDTPIAYSILSCLVTNLGISLYFAYKPGAGPKFLTRGAPRPAPER